MPKYAPITNWLNKHPQDNVVMSFSEIEKIIGARLPTAARKYFRWWDNIQGTPNINAIHKAGFLTVKVDLENELVRLKRARGS